MLNFDSRNPESNKLLNRSKKKKSKSIVYKTWKSNTTINPTPSPLMIELQRKIPYEDKFLQENTVLLKRWTIKHHLGNFGSHVYLAHDSKLNKNVAIKACLSETTTLEKEQYLLKKLRHLKCAPHTISCQLHPNSKPSLNFLVMTLCGPNTETLLKKCGTFSLSTVVSIGMQMLQAIEYLHCFGYIHRDIQPAHFVTSSSPRNHKIRLVGFSNSRSFLTKYRRHFIARRKPGFKGTLKYASPNAHCEGDLSRKDDLWSLLLSLLSYRTKLPWERELHHGSLAYLKTEKTEAMIKKHLSGPFLLFKQHLDSLLFYDEPDYDLLKMCFYKTSRIYGMRKHEIYDWNKM